MPKEITKLLTASQAPAPSPAEQIRQLMNKLAGNRAFAECRGNLKIPIHEILKSCDNPTQALAEFDRAVASRRIMVNMLAGLDRDELTYARGELWSALTDSDFLFTGETVPIQETIDGYLLIVDLDLTLTFLRWLYSTDYEKDIVPYCKGESIDPSRAMYGRLTEEVFGRFPKIEEELRERVYHDSPYPSLFYNPPIKFFSEDIVEPFWEKLKKWIPEYPRYDRSCIDVNNGSQGDQWRRGGSIAMFVTQIGIKKLLGCFSRAERKRLTVWHFKVPKVERENLVYSEFCNSPRMRIGLHPADQHEVWKSYHPSYVSQKVTRGLGAVLLTNDMVNDLFWDNSHMLNVTPMYVALGLKDGKRCEAPQEDMNLQRLLLSFPYPR